MRQYELMVILDPELDERTVQPSMEKFLSVVTKDGGSVDKLDIWGRRRLAYDINKKSEGIYVVVDFTAESATAAELDRQLGLNESVLRTKLLRIDVKARAAQAAADSAREGVAAVAGASADANA